MNRTALFVTSFLILCLFGVAAFGAVKKASFINAKSCVNCGTCIKVCPVKAISLGVVDGKKVSVIDPAKCVACGTCVKVCPTKSITTLDYDPKTKAYVTAAAPAKK